MVVQSVGLFVDYENIHISLANALQRAFRHEVLVRRLMELASESGEPVFRTAWADWDRFPGAQRVLATARFDTRFVPTTMAGKNSADMAMQAEILKLLNRDEGPQVFVIATGDRDFLFTVDELKRRGKRVILIGVEQTTSTELRQAAHQFFALTLPAPVPSAPPPEEASSLRRNHEDANPSPVQLEQVRQTLESLLQEKRMPWVSYRLFASHLVDRGVVSSEAAHLWIDRAADDGYIVREEDPSASRQGARRFCRFYPAGRGARPSELRSLPEGVEAGHRPLQRPARPSSPTTPPGMSSGAHASQTGTSGNNPAAQSSVGFGNHPNASQGAGFGGFDRADASSSFEEPMRTDPSRIEAQGPGRYLAPRSGGWGHDWRNFTFVKIVWALAELTEGKPARFFINPSSLLEALRREGIGVTEEEVFFWVNQSVDRGILIREVKELPGVPTQRFYRYYLAQHSRLVQLAEEVPRAILHTMESVLSKRTDWQGIAFNFLIKLLQVHPMLGNPATDFQPHRLREWLNFLIDEQLLFKFEEMDLKDNTRTTTMVGIRREHPQVQRFLRHAPDGDFSTPEHQALLRTILTIDHFLHWLHTKNPDEHWLPLMTLKTWLRSLLGDQLTKWAVLVCEKEGIFLIERFQNKGGGDTLVAGVKLVPTHPLVARTLEQRDEFLRILLNLLRNRAVIPSVLIEQRLRDSELFGRTPEERLGWLPLMVDTKVIAIERGDGSSASDGPLAYFCRVNSREKFVGELLNRVIRGPLSESQAEASAPRRTEAPVSAWMNPTWSGPGVARTGGSLFQDEPEGADDFSDPEATRTSEQAFEQTSDDTAREILDDTSQSAGPPSPRRSS